jgi:hypothetical protein
MIKRYLLGLLFFVPAFALAQPSTDVTPVDEAAVAKLMDEGINHSEVMDILGWLTDVYGPRLTNSPQVGRASDYAAGKLKEWGLQNVEKHKWGPFGKGWELKRFALHASTPYTYFPVLGYPKAWSPGHKKPVKGEVIYLKIDSLNTLASYKGKVKGKFVLIGKVNTPEADWNPKASRMNDERLLGLANAAPVKPMQRQPNAAALAEARRNFEIAQFLLDEKPLAILDQSYRGWGGQVAISSATLPNDPSKSRFEQKRPWQKDAPEPINQISLAREHFGRMVRLLEKGVPVTMELEMNVEFQVKDDYDYNVIGEIPGTDPALKDEIVMLGAHIDSWHTGTGTTDNAAGTAAMMEAVRLIKKSGIQPKRTIRIGLWSGEEQGLLGSIAYVKDTFADKKGDFWSGDTVLAKPAHKNLAAYFNLDNGSGQIRGIYLQENEPLRAQFREWLKPFKDWKAATVSFSNTGGTDHQSFDNVGLPGFQFIQDPLEYGTLTHHSNMDLYERAEMQDMKRNAVIIASFVLQTANLAEKPARKTGRYVLIDAK